MESRNFILTGSASRYYWKGSGLCSVKTFAGGPAFYNTGKGNFRVDEHSFLLLNDETEYAIEIDQRDNVDSFCLFFDRHLLQEAVFGSGRTTDYQLDNIGHYSKTPTYFERTYQLHFLQSTILKLQSFPLLSKDPLWVEQEFFDALVVINTLHGEDLEAREQLSALRAATRKELYARVLKAREYMHVHSEKQLGLREIALASHLSVNHLLRCFQSVFGISPHVYLTRLKIDRAKQLLSGGLLSVTAITEAVGFSSLGSFSLLFKRYCGVSPVIFRKIQTGDFR